MKIGAAAALAALTLSALAHAQALPSRFRFQVPPGWVDLSPGAPAESFRDLPPELAPEIARSGTAFFAVDVAHRSGGFLANVSAQVAPGAAPVTAQILDGIQADLDQQLGGGSSPPAYVVRDKRLVDFGGVTVGRVAGTLTLGSRQIAQVAFLIPGDDEHVVLTFSTTPERLAADEQVFDAVARATRGAVQPKTTLQKVFSGSGRGAVLTFVGAVLALLVIRRLRTRPSRGRRAA